MDVNNGKSSKGVPEMEPSNWRNQLPDGKCNLSLMDVNNGESSKGVPEMEHRNWRSQLPPEIRRKCIHNISLPSPDDEDIVLRFERKVYSTATSKGDYMHKICSNLHLQNFAAKLQLDSSSKGAGPADQGPIQTCMPNVVDQNSNFTNTSGVSQNPVGPSDNFPNSQRHVLENRQSRNVQQQKQQVLPQQLQMQNLGLGNVTHLMMQTEAPRRQQQRHLPLGQSQRSSTHAQPLDQQSHRSSTCSQPLDQQSKASTLIRPQSGSSSMVSDKNRANMQTDEGQKSRGQPEEQQLRSLVQSQLAMSQQHTSLSMPMMQQRHQTSDSSFQAWHVSKQQSPHSQSVVPAQSSMEVDSTTERRQENVDDWREEFYRVIKAIRDGYYTELNEALRRVEIRHRELASLEPKTEDYNMVNTHVGIARKMIQILQLSKDKIPLCLNGKLDLLKRSISILLKLYGPRRYISSRQKEQTRGVDSPNSKPQTQSHQAPQMNPHFQSTKLNHSTQKNVETSVQHELLVSSEDTTSHQNIVMNAQTQSTKSNILHSMHFQQQKEHQMKQQNLQIKATNGVGMNGGILLKHQNAEQGQVNNRKPQILEVGSSQVPLQTDPKSLQSPLLKPATPIQNADSSSGVEHTTGEAVEATPIVITEDPLQRLLRAVGSMSINALSASLNEMELVVNLVERTAGSAPGNGSRSLVGEDLAASSSRSLEGGYFIWEGMFSGRRKLRRFITTEPSETIATSSCKRFQVEPDHSLMEEIREVNQRLIDTVVDIMSDDEGAALTEVSKGTIVECIFRAITVSPNLNAHLSSVKLFPLQPLRLLVTTNYPSCSPMILDDLSADTSMDNKDLSVQAKSKLGVYLRSFEQPMKVGDIAKAWDICARAAICEYAEEKGGGSFSSKYGTWEKL